MRTITLFLLAMAITVACAGQSKSPEKEVHISRIPKPTAPADLQLQNLSFSDAKGNKNNILDAGEEAEISFLLKNTGKGDAYFLVAETSAINAPAGINLPNLQSIGTLKSGEQMEVKISLSGNVDMESGKALLQIKVKEGNGFDSDAIRVSFDTQRFNNPLVAVVDHKFTSNGGGKIQLGQVVTLNVVLQNRGQGDASDVRIQFTNPENIFPAGESNFHVPLLRPNESVNLSYDFFTNRKYALDVISIQVTATERWHKYGVDQKLSVSLEQNLSQTQTVVVQGEASKAISIETVSLTSDVDVNIPTFNNPDAKRFALVIGNEDYQRYQTGLNSDQNVQFARNDAITFKEYLTKTLGVPDKQVFLLTDATRGQMGREIDRVVELAKLTPNAELIFYYAGHGLPDQQNRQAYLIPVDVTASDLPDAFSLKDLYARLASSKADRIYVFLDACFSGGGRGENGLLAARTIKVKPIGDIVEGNIVAFTATSGEEVSLPIKKESHGLFTYYLLRKLKDTGGAVSLSELKKYLETEVPKASLIENGMKQTPQVLVAPDMGDRWLSWGIKN